MSDWARPDAESRFWADRRVCVTGGAGFLGLETIARLTGFEGRIVWDTSKPNGQPRRALDTERAWRAFGFRATTGFETGLRQTIEWYRRSSDQGGSA